METEDMTVAEPQDAAQQDAVSQANADEAAVEQKPYNGFAAKLDNFFGIRKNK